MLEIAFYTVHITIFNTLLREHTPHNVTVTNLPTTIQDEQTGYVKRYILTVRYHNCLVFPHTPVKCSAR